MLPALAVIAELATSEANLAITVPLNAGLMIPSIMAMLASVAETAKDANEVDGSGPEVEQDDRSGVKVS